MKLKNYILASAVMIAALAPQGAKANDPEDYMYVPEVVLNDKGEGTVTVWLKTNVTEYNSIYMNLYLPDGFTIEKDRRGNYVFTWNKEEDVVYDHTMVSADKTDPAHITFLGYSPSAEYILPGDHWLFKFNIQAPEGYNDTQTGTFKDIAFSEGTIRNHYFDDVTFDIVPDNIASGIEDISIDDSGDEEIYDLRGIRVKRPLAPGIYIVRQGTQATKITVK